MLSDGELGALRGRLKEQENEIEALKRRLDAPPIILAPPSVPIQEVPPQSCQETVISGPPAVLIPAKVPYAAAPVASEVLEPIVEEELPDELSESDVVTILLTCPGLDEVECILPRDLNPDDLVFELRKAVANAFGCPLGRASLLLGEAAVIMLGGDVDASFTPAAAAELAYGGALTFRIATGKLVTNAQLDAVAKSFESPHVSSPDLAASMGGARGTWGQGMQQVTRRSWSSQELETEDAGDAQLRDLRNELESTMSQVSDSEYLSAEEAESKVECWRNQYKISLQSFFILFYIDEQASGESEAT